RSADIFMFPARFFAIEKPLAVSITPLFSQKRKKVIRKRTGASGFCRMALFIVAALSCQQRTASQDNPVARFEVVSIRQSIPDRNAPAGARGAGGGPGGCKGGPPQITPARIVFNNNSLYTLIADAYALQCLFARATGLIVGGPEWVRSDQWVVQALIPQA